MERFDYQIGFRIVAEPAKTPAENKATDELEGVLEINNIEVVYNDVIQVLKGVSLSVPDRQIVTLLGGNGAGKSTTLKAISGLLRGELGEIIRGEITFMGERIDKLDPAEIVARGIFQVMEGRRVIEDMTVHENLRMGAYSRIGKPSKDAFERVYEYFPRLKERESATAGYLSGGEQQMLAIGRALMAKPRLILMDEPSMGLSPILVKEVFSIIKRINQEEKLPILLVEQNANMALRHAEHGYVMEQGKIMMTAPSSELLENEDIKEFYLGAGDGDHSFKKLKSFKRRKRWL